MCCCCIANGKLTTHRPHHTHMLFWFCILSESFWLSFQKFTLIPISRCQAAEDFSELDSDARSCSGLDSRNQLRSIYSKISNFYGSLIFPMFNSIDFIHRYFFPLPTSTARLLPSASPFSVSWMICNNNDKEIGHHQDSDNDVLFLTFSLVVVSSRSRLNVRRLRALTIP